MLTGSNFSFIRITKTGTARNKQLPFPLNRQAAFTIHTTTKQDTDSGFYGELTLTCQNKSVLLYVKYSLHSLSKFAESTQSFVAGILRFGECLFVNFPLFH